MLSWLDREIMNQNNWFLMFLNQSKCFYFLFILLTGGIAIVQVFSIVLSQQFVAGNVFINWTSLNLIRYCGRIMQKTFQNVSLKCTWMLNTLITIQVPESVLCTLLLQRVNSLNKYCSARKKQVLFFPCNLKIFISLVE